ncbi:adenosylcobinamide-phosphate synthase CbiB [Marinobacterium sediminicola]|uniref:Cobalamin biosynthesis protein CobD n=1 Tax=Marinobacterium sediminicola TaxID=518898 RepID=A0ABY1S1L0_9GAMM|nr:adenosylcobinamide-phosphate synthase CbiB [Marinobacterium sediminicola]ULG69422.1 adenosylcobinamide-phosphate synthase CbiB [Marinobacterium sediminicola]SMR75572.1 adenosylcobinamide-phosphate synthase [Marinobacterium sediminicola]
MLALQLIAALLIDRWLGEPARWHPLVGFGRCANWLEARCNYGESRRLKGLLLVVLLVVPPVLLIAVLTQIPIIGEWIAVLVLWFALGLESLKRHIQPILRALLRGDMPEARRLTSWICSRDAAELDVERTAVESVLENGSDAVFGALFWFCIAGAPGALAFRLINTLDAMWGYRSERFLHFGWAAARLDDLVGLIPARLTALSYALCGHTRRALHCWRTQAPLHDSPNAGPVMAAGAGALGVELGGLTCYRGVWVEKPLLGEGDKAQPRDLSRALHLVDRALGLWISVIVLLSVAGGL